MAKFAQYYMQYLQDELFSEQEWDNRQKHFGAFFETDKSIDFSLDKGEDSITYKHNVYHLKLNKDIIVMRIANEKTKNVIQDFKPVSVLHEPPCYVIIDNRSRCRRIAIQKNKESFNTTDSVKKILQKVLDKNMRAIHNIGIELHPQYYPRDFYKAWSLRQHSTTSIRFNFSEGTMPENFSGEDLEDQSIMDFAIKVNEEESRKKYKSVLELSPPENKTYLEVDYSSTFIRNLVKFHAQTGASIDIMTNDGSRFTCFIDDDEESDSIVTNEISTAYLDALFPENEISDDEEVKKAITTAESKLLEFVNKMKVEAEVDNGKEKVA